VEARVEGEDEVLPVELRRQAEIARDALVAGERLVIAARRPDRRVGAELEEPVRGADDDAARFEAHVAGRDGGDVDGVGGSGDARDVRRVARLHQRQREHDVDAQALPDLEAEPHVRGELLPHRRAADGSDRLALVLVLDVVLDAERVPREPERELTVDARLVCHLGSPDADAVVRRAADPQPIEAEGRVLRVSLGGGAERASARHRRREPPPEEPMPEASRQNHRRPRRYYKTSPEGQGG
jgi:hypothetical protein